MAVYVFLSFLFLWSFTLLFLSFFHFLLFFLSRPFIKGSVLIFGFAKGSWYLSSTTNQITPLPSVLLRLRVDWLGLFMAQFEAPLFDSYVQSRGCVRTLELLPSVPHKH